MLWHVNAKLYLRLLETKIKKNNVKWKMENYDLLLLKTNISIYGFVNYKA